MQPAVDLVVDRDVIGGGHLVELAQSLEQLVHLRMARRFGLFDHCVGHATTLPVDAW